MVKGNHFLHCLQKWHKIFIVIPPQKLLEGAHLFLLPCLLQLTINLTSSRGWLWQFQFDNSLFCGQSTFQWVKVVRVFSFERAAAAKFTVESIIRGKFCILHFIGVIKPFVGEVSFSLWSFVCLQEGIKTCCTSKKIHITNSWNSLNLNEIIWFVFLITVG